MWFCKVALTKGSEPKGTSIPSQRRCRSGLALLAIIYNRPLMFCRSDNRATDQLRPISITPEFITTAEGSVLVEVGNTRVICTASIEEAVPQFMRNSGKGWISSEYAMIPRATLTRTPREVAKGRPSGRTHEIQRLIGRSLRAVTDLDAIRRSHRLDRLRRNPGRRRHAHGLDHRGVRCTRPGAGETGTSRNADFGPAERFSGRGQRGHCGRRGSARPLL